MKDIKLRAWIYKEKKMVEVKSIHLGKAKIMYGYSEGPQCYGNKSLPFSECALSQSVGVEDKNGKEIFEGDIVRKKSNYLNAGETKIELYKVVWKEEWCAWALKKLGNCTQSCSMYKNELNFCEIVGNIYENPELLEENKNE